ncbi:MAG TPA: phosphate signaling complex protein PhoU [Deferrisomatales bacterium]|nr:phosphate signaling complex protein PhoU [Deferrisomatales bacterium]
MSTHLQQELVKLNKRLADLAETVQTTVQEAVRSVDELDCELARKIATGDAAIDRIEVDIEEECLKVLALYQPVATDLRTLVAVLKINNDIERIGDLAVNIAERTLFLCTQPPIEIPFDFAEMCVKALGLLRDSLQARLNHDVRLARRVCAADEGVDAINREMYAQISVAVRKDPNHVERLLSYLSVSRHLERIADYATNIAEDVIYLVEGRIARHKPTLEA